MTLISKECGVPASAGTTPSETVDLVDASLLASAQDVWATMLSWTAATSPVAQIKGKPAPFPLMAVNGCVGFAGTMTGSVFLSCAEGLAGQMAHAILGTDHSTTQRDISDVIGELTNMLAGGCVSRLRNSGLTLVMSIPNIIRGESIQAASKEVTFLIQRRFAMQGQAQHGDVLVTLIGKFE